MVLRGIALWNYVRDDKETIQALAMRLNQLGFEAVSYNGREFSLINEVWGER